MCEARQLIEDIKAFEKSLYVTSGNPELAPSLAMKTSAISFLRKVSERDVELADLIDEFDQRNDADWNDDSIQFPRLLSEVHAVITDEMIQKIAEAMGLRPSMVRKLFKRADVAFTRFEIFGRENQD